MRGGKPVFVTDFFWNDLEPAVGVDPPRNSALFDTHLEHEFYPYDRSVTHEDRVRGSKENLYARYGD
jgi:hypothetical protein